MDVKSKENWQSGVALSIPHSFVRVEISRLSACVVCWHAHFEFGASQKFSILTYVPFADELTALGISSVCSVDVSRYEKEQKRKKQRYQQWQQ